MKCLQLYAQRICLSLLPWHTNRILVISSSSFPNHFRRQTAAVHTGTAAVLSQAPGNGDRQSRGILPRHGMARGRHGLNADTMPPQLLIIRIRQRPLSENKSLLHRQFIQCRPSRRVSAAERASGQPVHRAGSATGQCGSPHGISVRLAFRDQRIHSAPGKFLLGQLCDLIAAAAPPGWDPDWPR